MEDAQHQQWIAAGEVLFRKQCDFAAGAAKTDQLPAPHMQEVAFVGRSNVGKSSLLNAITGRKSLARVSQEPGCTRQINFFNLNDIIYLVDLPGYGYARASQKDVQGWGKLIFDYLRGRAGLRRLFVLVDARHGLKDSDHEILKLMDELAVPTQLVLTKTDKASAAEIAKAKEGVAAVATKYIALHPEVVLTSSREGQGVELIRAEIAAIAGFTA